MSHTALTGNRSAPQTTTHWSRGLRRRSPCAGNRPTMLDAGFLLVARGNGFKRATWAALPEVRRLRPRGANPMNDRVCLSPFCGTRTTQRLQRCPACGRPMFGREEIVARGRDALQ